MLEDISVGFSYLLPVLIAWATLNGVQITGMAVLCGYPQEAFDPLQMAALPRGFLTRPIGYRGQGAGSSP